MLKVYRKSNYALDSSIHDTARLLYITTERLPTLLLVERIVLVLASQFPEMESVRSACSYLELGVVTSVHTVATSTIHGMSLTPYPCRKWCCTVCTSSRGSWRYISCSYGIFPCSICECKHIVLGEVQSLDCHTLLYRKSTTSTVEVARANSLITHTMNEDFLLCVSHKNRARLGESSRNCKSYWNCANRTLFPTSMYSTTSVFGLSTANTEWRGGGYISWATSVF